uniref:Uncharacterized protein n=1 Tax=Parascaris univalens TaxID=6257 RepID=A0A915AXA2_PARUN
MQSTVEVSIDQSTLPNTSFNRGDIIDKSNKYCISYILVAIIVFAALSFAIVWVIALVILKKERHEILLATHRAQITTSSGNHTVKSLEHTVAKPVFHDTSNSSDCPADGCTLEIV